MRNTLITIATSYSIFGLPALLREPKTKDLPPYTLAATNGKDIYLSPLKNLNSMERVTVILHECLHILLGHILRAKNKNIKLWNIATDIVVNNILRAQGLPLPDGSIFDPNLSEYTAEQIYNMFLKGEISKIKIIRGGHQEEVGLDVRNFDEHLEGVSEEELEEYTRRVATAVRMKGRGILPGVILEELEYLDAPRVSWYEILRKYIVESLPSDLRFLPLGKKSYTLRIPLPGVVRSEGLRLYVAIDTSGSMSSEDLGKLASVLKHLSETYDIEGKVLLCDAKLHEEVDIHTWLRHPYAKGRGGTDYKPVFDKLVRERFDGLLIYMTDAVCEFPPKPPFDIIWVLTTNKDVPYGKVVRIK